MKKLALLLSFIFLLSCQQQDINETAKLKLSLPDFQSNDVLTGISYNKKSFINPTSKASYIHFWATWCGPCEAEFPEFIRYAKKLEKFPIHFITIAVNDKPEAIKKYLKKYGELPKNMIILMDPDNMSQKFGTNKLPETYLLGGSGQYFTKFIGPQSWSSPFYSEQVKKNLLKN
jgi:cytochrome c biogenesis protein CcmG, thiol:disulfide interchange protein DsbE